MQQGHTVGGGLEAGYVAMCIFGIVYTCTSKDSFLNTGISSALIHAGRRVQCNPKMWTLFEVANFHNINVLIGNHVISWDFSTFLSPITVSCNFANQHCTIDNEG